jgi:Tfp pilus assembly protein FimT
MNDVVGKGGVMTTRSRYGASHNRKHCLKRDGSNKSTRLVVLGRPVAQTSSLDTDGFDHILFKKHQTALKKTFNAALKRHSTTQRQHGLRLSWIV